MSILEGRSGRKMRRVILYNIDWSLSSPNLHQGKKYILQQKKTHAQHSYLLKCLRLSP